MELTKFTTEQSYYVDNYIPIVRHTLCLEIPLAGKGLLRKQRAIKITRDNWISDSSMASVALAAATAQAN